MKQIALAAVVVASLAGCSLLRPAPVAPQSIQFNYTTVNGEAAGLVRVFNIKGDTVLQFIDISKVQPKVYDAGQTAPVSYQVIGQYAIVTGVHQSLRVQANGSSATSIRTAGTAPFPATVAPAVSPDEQDKKKNGQPHQADAKDVALLQALAELTQTKKDLAEAKQELVQLQKLNIQLAPALIVPMNEKPHIWTLLGNKTLKENLNDMAQAAGYAGLSWRASNPYMVRYTTTYKGTFLEVLGQIADAVPGLEFKIYRRERAIDVVDVGI